jgi:hypothetical protein
VATPRRATSGTVQVSGGFDDAGKRILLTETIRGPTDAQAALTRRLRKVDKEVEAQRRQVRLSLDAS